ncbi:hydroxypyruvate isomerase [Thalassospiraceae bacterium LMO-JJ14]|nr:hydroxypyruvate isomerase [Thalassospiraceae bacterium LMO-JJ14]
MPRFAANLSMLFGELDFLDRFEAASEAGFRGVEYLFPYAYDPDVLASRLQAFGLQQVLHNLPAGDWDAGERGIACHPGRVEEFHQGVHEAIRYATALGCTQLNCLAGVLPEDADPDVAHATFVSNLKYAAMKLKEAGICLLIEPINTRDIPGFFLNATSQARAYLDEVGADNLFIQYDIYHMQIMEGDLAPTIRDNLDVIKHIQLADTPGRHEPGTGEINYGFLFNYIDELGYDGWIGCEYKPAGDTREGLGWLASATAA